MVICFQVNQVRWLVVGWWVWWIVHMAGFPFFFSVFFFSFALIIPLPRTRLVCHKGPSVLMDNGQRKEQICEHGVRG